MSAEVRQVDYLDASQVQQLLTLMDEYARDQMGGGEPLSDFARENLAKALSSTPGAFSLIVYVDNQAAGFVNCFQAFSTFQCKPLINIHDLAVAATQRGKGLAKQLLDAVDTIARERGCCKVTLEVLEGNQVAKAAYTRHGFKAYQLEPSLGKAEFWQHSL